MEKSQEAVKNRKQAVTIGLSEAIKKGAKDLKKIIMKRATKKVIQTAAIAGGLAALGAIVSKLTNENTGKDLLKGRLGGRSSVGRLISKGKTKTKRVITKSKSRRR